MRKSTGFCTSIALIVLATSGCVWHRFEPSTDYSLASNIAGCPSVGLQNIAEDDRSTILESVAAACDLVHSQDFEDEMKDRELLPYCGATELVSGEEVVRQLRSQLPNYSVIIRKPWRSEAVTNVSFDDGMRMAIRRQRVDSWANAPKNAFPLIDTTVHEWTHLITKKNAQGDHEMLYRDSGHSSDENSKCYQGKLVSYASGFAAIEVWKERHK